MAASAGPSSRGATAVRPSENTIASRPPPSGLR